MKAYLSLLPSSAEIHKYVANMCNDSRTSPILCV